jgi:hypothetical protein
MLVSVANWLRWRRLAKASPGRAALINGYRNDAPPKYCNRPIAALADAATSQVVAVHRLLQLPIAHQPVKHPAQISQGIKAVDGPPP